MQQVLKHTACMWYYTLDKYTLNRLSILKLLALRFKVIYVLEKN